MMTEEVVQGVGLDAVVRQNPSFLAGLAASLPCIVWATDADLRLTAFTGKGLGPPDARPERVVGLPLVALFPPDDSQSPAALDAHRGALAGQASAYETTGYHERSYLSYVHPQRGPDGAVVGCLGLSFDVTDSRRAERISRTKYLTTKTLNETENLAEALPPILKAVCETLGWEYGGHYVLDPAKRTLEFAGAWLPPGELLAEFSDVSRGLTFRLGDRSLPGRVVASGAVEWVPDVGRDPNFQRAKVAREVGLHSAVAFPVVAGGEVYGVIEFFSRRVIQPDSAVTDMMTIIGIHIGGFLERGRAKEALRANEERFAAFMDNSPAVAFIKDAAGRFTYTNGPLHRRFDTRPGDWLGKTDADLWTPELARTLREHDLAVLGGAGAAEYEEAVPTPEGERHWLVYKFPFRGGDGATSLGGMALDITDRKRADADVRLRDRAIESFVQGVCITDASRPDNPIVYANGGFRRMTGYAADEVGGRNCRFLQGPKTDPEAVERVRAAVRGGTACVVELLNYRKDGTTFWNALSVSPVHDDAGALTHFVAVQTDITPLKRLEQQFRQAQKMDAFGQLAGGVAHDFNNLLTVILGYSDMLLEGLRPGHPDREVVGEIHKAGERAASLTRQLLAFSRQQLLEPKVLNLNAVVADAETMLRRLLGEDVRFATATAPALRPVKVDAGQMEQVILNLCVNARDAMPRGGQLTVETANADLDDEFSRSRPEVKPGRYVLLAVSDTGCGMPPDVQARVFEPFFTTKGPGKGTGLGLATVYGIVKQSGGFVYVYSEMGRGTTFRVYLPAVEQAVPAGGSGPVAWPPARGSETVLVVEDEDAVRDIVRLALRSQGYTVLEASRGAEAVRVAAAHAGPIHLLVTDVVMPEMGGRELSERLARTRPGLKVMYLSGYTDDAVVRHGVLESQSHFLQKPFTPGKLAAKIRQVLDQH